MKRFAPLSVHAENLGSAFETYLRLWHRRIAPLRIEIHCNDIVCLCLEFHCYYIV